jgi:tetratricopeptide (TPR) repeat protein
MGVDEKVPLPEAGAGDEGRSPVVRRARRWRGPRWPLLAVIALVLIAGLGGMLVAGIAGVRDGLQLREAQAATAVAVHLQRGLEYLQKDELTLARAEFGRVLELQPDHEGALARLYDLDQQQAGEDVPTPVPVPTATPLPTATQGTPQPDALDALLADARQQFVAAHWEEVILRLQQLSAIAPDFDRAAVEEMLFQAHYQLGLELLRAEHMEAALRSFGDALALRPDDAEVQEQRDLLALYTQAVGTWGADWSETIAAFADLYARQPDFRDVEQRLVDAYSEYGAALARKTQWCAAAEQYAGALAVRDDPEVARQRDEAEVLCRTATPTPEADLTPAAAVPVTASVAAAGTALPSLGGGHIVFGGFDEASGQRQVWLVPADGGELKLLAVEASQPALSADGTSVAFRSLRSDMLGLAVMPLTGGEWQRVTSYAEDSFPDWSSDGQRLVFASDREGDRKWRVYEVWVGGESSATTRVFGRSPAFSPDGTRIAYQGCNAEGGRCGLWLVGLDGSREQLTDIPGDTAPAWSPDGQRLAFASHERSGNWEIYLLDVSGGEVTALSPHPANDGQPAWSPDGRRLAFVSDREGSWAILLLDTTDTDSSPVRLVEIPGGVPDWPSCQISWGP